MHSPANVSIFTKSIVRVPRRLFNDDAGTLSLIVNEVTAFNRHLLPSFDEVKFEFFSLSQSNVSKRVYHELIQRVLEHHHSNPLISITAHSQFNDDAVLKSIVDNFGERHAMDLEVESTSIMKREGGTARCGTAIHVDGSRGPFIRLWIPLTFIDNLCLGVGDSTNMLHPKCVQFSAKDDDECADGTELEKVVWYQQMAMSNEDWIFFRSDKVPHYAAHLPSRRTQSRIAWAVNIKHADPELHRQHLQSRQSALFALHSHVQ